MTTSVFNHKLPDGKFHKWNASLKPSGDPPQSLTDYYQNEDLEATCPRKPEHHFNRKALKRHFAFTSSSLMSCQKIVQQEIRVFDPSYKLSDIQCSSRADVHDISDLTHFTALNSFSQKHFLACQSGMAGLLITRFLGVKKFGVLKIKLNKKYTDLFAKYSHSAFSSEVLIGNRYFYGLPQIIRKDCAADLRRVVGATKIGCWELVSEADLTPEKISETDTMLTELYEKHIETLLADVNQFKLGKMAIGEIRNNCDYVKLLHTFWHYANQLMKIQSKIIPHLDCSDVKRIIAVTNICVMPAKFPKLFSYDIAHIMDSPLQHYAKFVKTTKQTLIRLANDGLTSAFLSFAAIEPNMVLDHMAPMVDSSLSGFTLKCQANYIPSRHTILGSLRIKYNSHIPTWKNMTYPIVYRSRDRFNPMYYPVQLQLEDLRTGQPENTKMKLVNKKR